MEFTPMINIRSLTRVALAGALFLTAGVAMAQHDVGGGSTSGAGAAGTSGSRPTVKRTPRKTPTTVRKPGPPVRRGTTAEQYNQQGDALFEAKQYDDAFEAYTKAVELKPIASAYYHIGWIYNDREDYDQAVIALQQSVRLNPNEAVPLNELAYSYKNLKRYPEALDTYRRAIAVRPNYALPYYQIGWIYNDQGQYTQAIEPLKQAASLKDNYAEAHEELGFAYFKLNRSQEAIAAYQNAVQMKPDYGAAYLGLGDVYFYQTKQYAPAMNAYREGVRYIDSNPTAFYNLAWCANELNRYAEAAGAARQAIALKAAYPEAHLELGYANRKLGEAAPDKSPQALRLFDEAIANYREAIRLKLGYGLAYTGLGDVYFIDLKQYPQAVLPYQQSISITPNNVRVRYNLGWTYNDLTRYAEAADQLKEAARLKPEYVEAHSELGFAYLKLHRLPLAMESLRTAIRLKPEYALAHYYLGLVFIETRNKLGAQEQYRILQRLDPKKAQQLFDAAPPNMKN